MTRTLFRSAFTALLAASLFGTAAQAQVPPFDRSDAPGPPPAVPGEEAEPQTRGPVHEGFAAPAAPVPSPALTAPKEPPAPLDEVPPAIRPEGEGVTWVPGYWAWDDIRGDFIWVSGAWRVAPIGRKWVPGYWAKTADGYAYVRGFWADAALGELPYSDAPPEPLDDPVTDAPDDSSAWVPGMWVVRDGRFHWRRGYWLGYKPGWVYNPPCWAWTPRGYLLVGAFWDYPLGDRGVLFAPCHVPRGLWGRPFTPALVVGVGPLTGSLWLRPGLGYAYGDYYGPVYARRGYQAWAVHGSRVRDPLYGYYRAANIGNPAWERGLASTYRGRVAGDIARPPRSLAAQERLVRAGTASTAIVTELSRYRPERVRMTTVTATERVERERTATALRRATVERRTVETARVTNGTRPAALPIRDVPTPRPARVETPRLAPRVETPRPGTPRIETPRTAPPRADTPRAERPAPPRAEMPRIETPRTQPAPPPPRVTAPPPRPVTPPPAPRVAPPPPPRPAPPPRAAPPPRPKATAPAPKARAAPPPAPRATPPAPRQAPVVKPPAPKGERARPAPPARGPQREPSRPRDAKKK